MPAVETVELRREFDPPGLRKGRRILALDDVNLAIDDNEIHGLLGPNGAGKTTLIKILSTILLPTSGSARVLGRDVVEETAAVRGLIGLVFGGDRGLYTRLTARQNLDYWAALYGVSATEATSTVDKLLSMVGLEDRAADRVETFSRGMRQRLHLARGLVGDPPVIFLDEPTVGLDPVASHRFRELINELRGQGKTILLATHDMVEAEAVCDRVTLIDNGQLLTTESPRTLGSWISAFEWVEALNVDDVTRSELAELVGMGSVSDQPGGWIRFQPEAEGIARVALETLISRGYVSVRTGFPTLEEVYVQVVGDRGMQI